MSPHSSHDGDYKKRVFSPDLRKVLNELNIVTDNDIQTRIKKRSKFLPKYRFIPSTHFIKCCVEMITKYTLYHGTPDSEFRTEMRTVSKIR